MKILEHPNIVNLIEVIDDPDTDDFYMGIVFFLYFVGYFSYLSLEDFQSCLFVLFCF